MLEERNKASFKNSKARLSNAKRKPFLLFTTIGSLALSLLAIVIHMFMSAYFGAVSPNSSREAIGNVVPIRKGGGLVYVTAVQAEWLHATLYIYFISFVVFIVASIVLVKQIKPRHSLNPSAPHPRFFDLLIDSGVFGGSFFAAQLLLLKAVDLQFQVNHEAAFLWTIGPALLVALFALTTVRRLRRHGKSNEK